MPMPPDSSLSERPHLGHAGLQVVSAGWALPAVLACRALVGLGEGLVMPSMNTIMATRVPATWRSSALGVVYSGFHAGQQPPPWAV